ncbi:glycosyltransferase family 2 protein [Micromonospora sp. NPDC049891]|uniref:glycosyltransferase family 2 protein n=1 Tax=Micromonospora sp. NPDC049891 TaxID=3155655 RepID=UPI0033D9D86C
MTAGALRVSVVVPTYNPGECLDRLVASLLRQSLPANEFEVIFVDDGSTDATPARLDALAAAHRHFHVLHAERSGWPSRPRNLGVAQASGEYVQFVDDDDWLADEALARLYGYAAENGADIAIGRMAGHGRSVPRELFRVNRPDATLADAPLMESLTCHKMFRRAFLSQHDLRFPEEGRKRLEDHHLVTRATTSPPLGSSRRDTSAACVRSSTSSTRTPSRVRCVTGCTSGGCASRWSAGCAAPGCATRLATGSTRW